MANLKRTTAPQVAVGTPASQANEVVRYAELQAALAGKQDVGGSLPYESIYNFESGVQASLADYLGASWSVQWQEESGVQYPQVRLAGAGGLVASEAGIALDFGDGLNQAARGNHTHAQLHDAVTLGSGETVQLTLNGQELRAEVRLVGSHLMASASGIAANIGTTAGTLAAGDHSHAGLELAHAAVTKVDTQTVVLTLNGQELRANLRWHGAGIVVSDSGLRLDIGTGAAQLAAGNHTHDQLHDAVTKVDGQSITFTLAGQQLTAEVRLKAESGLQYDDSGIEVRLRENGGLRKGVYGLEADSGVVALAGHTHSQLHDPFAIDPSVTLNWTLAGQRLAAEVKLEAGGGLEASESGLRVEPGRYAAQNHTHSEFHAPVTVVNSNSVILALAGQQITATAKLDANPSAGRGLLGVTSAGLYVVLGDSGNQAAPGNHEHDEATEVLGGFMSASDKYKLNRLSSLDVEDTGTVLLELDSGILRANVRYGYGLTEGESGLEIRPDLTDTTTVRLQFQSHRLSASIKYGPGLAVGESGLQIDNTYLAGQQVQLATVPPPLLAVGQVPALGVSTRAMREDAKPGLPGLATSAAHGFMDKADKARFDLSHIGNFNGTVNALLVDRTTDTVYVIGEFTKAGNAVTNRIAAVQFNGMVDQRFDAGAGFDIAPQQIQQHSSGDLLVTGTTAKLSYRGGAAAWIHKLSRRATPDASFTSPTVIAATGADTLLGIAPLANGRIAVNSWQTFRLLSATGSTVVSKNGGVNFHHVTSEGNNAYLMSRRASAYDGTTNPRAIKKIPCAVDTAAIDSGWTTNGGTGGEANASYSIMSPDGRFLIAANSIEAGNGGGSSYAWNGGSASRHTGLYKIKTDGTEDSGWNIDLVLASDWPRPLAIDSQGRVYFTGDITQINGTAVTPSRLYRVNADGAGLVVFDGFNGKVTDAKLVGDDYLVVGGEFTQYGNMPVGRFLFMDAEGRAVPFIPSSRPTKFETKSIHAGSEDTELEMRRGKRFLAVEFAVALPVYAPYLHKVVLSRKQVIDGESMLLQFDMPASTDVSIEVYDNVASGTPLLAFTGKATAAPLFAEFRLDPDTGGWRLMTLGYLVDDGSATDPTKVAKAGDTMTGFLTLSADPSSNLHASTKQYTDTKVPKSGGTMTGLLEFSGTTHGGVRLNNLTQAQRDGLTVKPVGCPIWNSTAGRMEVWNGTAWQSYALSSAEYALYTENGAGGELYATGNNAVALGSYGLASGAGAFALGSNTPGGSATMNRATGAKAFVGGGQGLLASGVNAVCLGGNDNTASATNSVCLGGNNNDTLAGLRSAIIGGQYNSINGQLGGILGGVFTTVQATLSASVAGYRNFVDAVSGGYAVALGGYRTTIDQFGEVGAAANTLGDGTNDVYVAQQSSLRLTGKTTDGVAKLIGPQLNATRQTVKVRTDKSVWKFAIDLTAHSAGGLVKTWEAKGAIKRLTGVGTLAFVGVPDITSVHADSGTAAWTLALDLNTSTGEFEFEVAGESGVEVYWGGDLRWLKAWQI